MLVIRLKRVGKRNKAQFRIVLQEKTQAPRAKALEFLGSFDPHQKDGLVFKKERVLYWISQGAQPSTTLHNMLVSQGVIQGKKRRVVAARKKEVAKPEAAAPKADAKAETDKPVAEKKAEPAPDAKSEKKA